VEAHYIFNPSTRPIWVRPLFTELGPKKPTKADFAMKQTNIRSLSGDINYLRFIVNVVIQKDRSTVHVYDRYYKLMNTLSTTSGAYTAIFHSPSAYDRQNDR